MVYVAVKGGQEAIDASVELLSAERLQNGKILDTENIRAGLRILIDQVMSEASLHDPDIAAIAIKQAEGSPEEAVFLLRAFRSTLPRKHISCEANPESMQIERRISAAFKDIPGGQILGATTDYTHRLIDFSLAEESQESAANWLACFNRRQFPTSQFEDLPKVVTFLRQEGLMAPTLPCTDPLIDVTMESVSFPTTRSQRLQILTRGQTGAVTALGYAALRGWGSASLHPTVGELRVGMLPLEIQDPLGSDTDDEEENHYYIGEIRVTEVESFIPMNTQRPDGREEIDFSIGYGLCMGHNETKTIAMSILDNCLEIGDPRFPTHDEEFVLLHIDSVEATGFISHLKLPHYVTFQSKLDSLRKSRQRSA